MTIVRKWTRDESVVGERKLTPEQLADAWRRLADKDLSAEQDIVAHHIGIVRYLLGRFNTGRYHDACESAALDALLAAVRKFDPTRGTKFSTHAWNTVRNAIRSCLSYEHKRRRYNQIVRVGLDKEFWGSEDGDEPVDDRPNPYCEPDLAKKVKNSIVGLPKNLRIAARKRFIHGHSFQVVATALGRKCRGSGFHAAGRAAMALRPKLADHEPGTEDMPSRRLVREFLEDVKMAQAELDAKKEPRVKRRAHHQDSCPACGHTHRGQIDVGNGELKCKRCGYVHKAKTQEGKA